MYLGSACNSAPFCICCARGVADSKAYPPYTGEGVDRSRPACGERPRQPLHRRSHDQGFPLQRAQWRDGLRLLRASVRAYRVPASNGEDRQAEANPSGGLQRPGDAERKQMELLRHHQAFRAAGRHTRGHDAERVDRYPEGYPAE